MSDPTFSREQVAALEKVLGVKLPEQGFSLEIRPIGPAPLSDAQLDQVVGGTASAGVPGPLQVKQVGIPQIPIIRWSAKI